MIILGANYGISKRFSGHRLAPLLTWVFNITILFANDRFSGYRFSSVASALQVLVRQLPVVWNINIVINASKGRIPRHIPPLAHKL